MKIEIIAMVCHEANRAWCEGNNDFSQKKWEDAEIWQQEAAIAGVKFRLENPDVPVSATHNDWMANKLADGWKYGPNKNMEIKTHPCLIPFDDLPEYEKKKDYLFQAIVKALK